ncbi:MAG: aldose 1-epimerase family protein [Planctomycetaceae bacterium]|nr:aldose 1-epimerase family protein [Planctomycetaceae bacterium]
MALHQFELLNVSQKVGKPAWELSAETGPQLAETESWFVELRRMRGGMSDGIDVVTINNGVLELDLLPTRGMGIWKGECNGLRLGWDSPVKLPVHPSLVNLEGRGQIGWLDGFSEWICRCGLAFNGPPGPDEDGSPLTLHGKIANLAAHEVHLEIDDETGRLTLTGVVDESSMFGTNLRLTSKVTLYAGQPTIQIEDTVTNCAAVPQEYELLYHINQGAPFLSDDSEVLVPFTEMSPRDERGAEGVETWNRYQPPEMGYAEQVYFFKPASDDDGNGQILLQNEAENIGLHLTFQTETLPFLALWKNTLPHQDGYVTGMEPCTDFPNHRSEERQAGRLKSIDGGASVTHQLQLRVARDADELHAVWQVIQQAQKSSKSVIHPTPSF